MMSIRSTYFLGFFIIVLLLSTSLYLQFFDGIMPCPLCTLQRFTFVILGFVFLIGIFLHNKYVGRLIVNSLALLGSLLGIFLAGRQVWLQNFGSADSNECGVSLQYMLQVLPVNEVAKKIFAGSAECSQRGWEFLHLNMAEWSLIWFFLFLFISIYLFFKGSKTTKPW